MNQELAERELGNLAQAPVIDLINPQQLALLKSRAARGCNDGEIAQFLELCVAYKLDPYAGEVWCAKGRGADGSEGRLLIMVGRDGLRKIAHRQGLHFDGDVVRANDQFKVTRTGEREREIDHVYEDASGGERGEIIGAWAEVYDEDNHQRGYFFARLDEYMPTNQNQVKYSPWGKQTSVMILAAAERQALRQATPLGGLLVEGEDARVGEPANGAAATSTPDLVASWATDAETAGAILGVLHRADQLGHAGLSDYATVELTLKGRAQEDVERWIVEAHAELTMYEQKLKEQADAADAGEVVQDAEVVEDPKPGEGVETETGDPTEPPPPDDPEKEAKALALLAEADAAEVDGDIARADALREEAQQLHDEARQGDLGL